MKRIIKGVEGRSDWVNNVLNTGLSLAKRRIDNIVVVIEVATNIKRRVFSLLVEVAYNNPIVNAARCGIVNHKLMRVFELNLNRYTKKLLNLPRTFSAVKMFP